MLTGVEILLERMKTNPEEFVDGGYSKWSRVMGIGWDIFTEEERTAIQDAHTQAKRDHFSGEVMKVLAQGHDDPVTMNADMEDRIYKGKRLMQGYSDPRKILAPQNMIAQAQSILEDEFDKAYAENINNQVVAPQRRTK